MSDYGKIWQTLSAIDCSKMVEKKGGLTYLSWAHAWGVLMKHYPEAQWRVLDERRQDDGTTEVGCIVSIGECNREMYLPVMDHRNKAIANPDKRAINDARMRCMVKCLALYGLGLYIYQGEELPSSASEAAQATQPSQHTHNELKSLLEATQADLGAFLKYLGADSLQGLTEQQAQRGIAALKQKQARNGN